MTTNPRIEAAARALCSIDGRDPDSDSYALNDIGLEVFAGKAWEEYVPSAAAALAAADAAAWRPIEDYSGGNAAVLLWAHGRHWTGELKEGEWVEESGTTTLAPTHFQPLPPPPQIDEAEVGG